MRNIIETFIWNIKSHGQCCQKVWFIFDPSFTAFYEDYIIRNVTDKI